MAEANSCGTRLSFEVVTPGAGIYYEVARLFVRILVDNDEGSWRASESK